MSFVKFLRTTFSIEHLWWLFLDYTFPESTPSQNCFRQGVNLSRFQKVAAIFTGQSGNSENGTRKRATYIQKEY